MVGVLIRIEVGRVREFRLRFPWRLKRVKTARFDDKIKTLLLIDAEGFFDISSSMQFFILRFDYQRGESWGLWA